MKWLLEPEVFNGELAPLINALERRNVPHQIVEFGKEYHDVLYNFIEKFHPKDYNVFLQGSVQLLRTAVAMLGVRKDLIAGFERFACSYYYPRYGYEILNCDYLMVPLGSLRGKYQSFVNVFDTSVLFLRPDKAEKAFTGMVVSLENWDSTINKLEFKMYPQDMIVVAPAIPGGLAKEWRLVVIDGQIITGSQYRENGKEVRIAGIPDYVMDYAKTALRMKFRPDSEFVLDICELYWGNERHLRILEVGCFSCSGLYLADPDAILDALEE